MTTTKFDFPHPTLTPIVGKPSLATLTLLKSELYANAMVTDCELGGGNHGYLALAMSPLEYALQQGTIPFIEPVNPGAQAAHTPALNARQITEANRRHDYAVARYTEYKAIKNQLKLQLIGAVHATYIAILRDPIFGLANVEARAIIVHLMDTYGTCTIEDLEANRNQVMNDWNPDTDIEHLWTRATACKTFAEGTTLALSDDAIMNLLLIPLERTKVFQDDIKDWRVLPSATKTWEAFKEHFTERNKERTRTLNTGAAGYNALAAATADLTIQPAASTHAANAATTTTPANTATNRRTSTNNANVPAVASLMDEAGAPVIKLYYCHSCGLSQFKNHTSITCNRPKAGHKTDATLKNMMNGSTTFAIRSRTTADKRASGATTTPPTNG